MAKMKKSSGHFDIIIGDEESAAGAVMLLRLSEKSDKRVLLLEGYLTGGADLTDYFSLVVVGRSPPG